MILLSALSFRAAAEDFTNAIRAFLQQRIEVQKRDVGIVVGIVDEQGGRIISYGRMNAGTGQAVNGETVFLICSVTKTFTGLLLQEGLLGHVITLKAGTNYETLVRDRICRPLKMDSTRIALTPELQARSAPGHNELGYELPGVISRVWTNGPNSALAPPSENQWRNEAMVGVGELHSTANDMLKYLSVNLGLTLSSLTPLMEKTHLVYFRQPRNNQSRDIDMGLAWFVTPGLRGTKIISHDGDSTGFSSFAGFDKTRHRGAVNYRVLGVFRGFNPSCIAHTRMRIAGTHGVVAP